MTGRDYPSCGAGDTDLRIASPARRHGTMQVTTPRPRSNTNRPQASNSRTPCAGAGIPDQVKMIPDQEILEGVGRQGASSPCCSAVHSRGILKPPADTSRLSCHGHMGGTRMFVLPVWCYVR
ncbi:hypothetical protein CT154_12490 [Komagataeibacter xylinus]|nr:hypothetical protein CT154_12490 [Komagataeibacter xylinus]